MHSHTTTRAQLFILPPPPQQPSPILPPPIDPHRTYPHHIPPSPSPPSQISYLDRVASFTLTISPATSTAGIST